MRFTISLRRLLKAAQLGLFSSDTVANVKSHRRVSKSGKVTQVKQHTRKKEPPKPAPAKPEESERPMDEDRSGRTKHHDAGEKIEGARKHSYNRIRAEHLDEIESRGELAAHKQVTKAKVLGKFDAERQQGLGDTSGAAYWKDQMLRLVDSKPVNSAADRLRYVQALDWIAHQLDGLHTVKEMEQWIEDFKLMARGMSPGEVIDAKQLAEAVGLTDDDMDPSNYSYGGAAYIDHPSGEMKEEQVSEIAYGGKVIRPAGTEMVPKRAKVPYAKLRAAGYEEIARVSTPEGPRYKLVKKDQAMGDTYRGYADALGPRFIKGVLTMKPKGERRRPKRGTFWTKHAGEARSLEKDADWGWTGKTSGGGGGGQRWKRHVGKTVERVGPPIGGKVDEQRMLSDFNLRGVQFGNWVNDSEASANLKACHAALTDLADIIGVPTQALAHGSMLGIAFGARGAGNASAHYEPQQLAINLTKTKGGGSLAHEWGHFMDHILTGTVRGPGDIDITSTDGRPRSKFLSHGENLSALPKPVASAIQGVMRAIEHGGGEKTGMSKSELDAAWKQWDADSRVFNRKMRAARDTLEASKLAGERKALVRRRDELKSEMKNARSGRSQFYNDAQALGDYWGRRHEMFARAWESFIEDELAKRNRKNTYLVAGTASQYKVVRAKVKRPLEPYPQGADRQAINKAMRTFCDALVKSGALQKALARFTITVSPAQA